MTILSGGEVTEVWDGEKEIISGSLKLMGSAKSTFDLCADSTGPSSISSFDPIRAAYFALERRGVKVRFITEITPANLSKVRELMKAAEVRHLVGIVGSFAVADRSDYAGSSSVGEDGGIFRKLVASNVKSFVELQRYFFDTLWVKATPAERKIKEIERGIIETERIELIPDTQESIAKAFDLIKRTKKELLVLYASFRTFALAMTMDTARLYDEMTKKGVDISIIVPNDPKEPSTLEVLKRLHNIAPDVHLKVSDATLRTMITILVSDRKEFMSWELKDDTLKDPYEAGGAATYSNNPSLASSYATILDNLWAISELAENLRTANTRLAMNEEAMKEFIDIASHELRTPIQPILGLSQLLREWDWRGDQSQSDRRGVSSERSDKRNGSVINTLDNFQRIGQMQAIDVITRNAQRLQRLAENILDVTRIESGRLRLHKAIVDINKLIESEVREYRNNLERDKTASRVKLILEQPGKRKSNGVHFTTRQNRLYAFGDKERLGQVVTNLISNAAKFSKKGKITIRVDATAAKISSPDAITKENRSKKIANQTLAAGVATISISDEGPGINEEILPRLFDNKFVSGSRGAGLSLYVSKKIVEAHGGMIWAENNDNNGSKKGKGRGATFAFSLPLIAGPRPTASLHTK